MKTLLRTLVGAAVILVILAVLFALVLFIGKHIFFAIGFIAGSVALYWSHEVGKDLVG